jgi:hypothetical protein
MKKSTANRCTRLVQKRGQPMTRRTVALIALALTAVSWFRPAWARDLLDQSQDAAKRCDAALNYELHANNAIWWAQCHDAADTIADAVGQLAAYHDLFVRFRAERMHLARKLAAGKITEDDFELRLARAFAELGNDSFRRKGQIAPRIVTVADPTDRNREDPNALLVTMQRTGHQSHVLSKL